MLGLLMAGWVGSLGNEDGMVDSEGGLADEVRRIAKLAQLGVGEGDVERWVEHFRGMLGFVAKLEEVDVEGVELGEGRSLEWKELREDGVRDVKEAGASLRRDESLSRAPDADDDCFFVPGVME